MSETYIEPIRDVSPVNTVLYKVRRVQFDSPKKWDAAGIIDDVREELCNRRDDPACTEAIAVIDFLMAEIRKLKEERWRELVTPNVRRPI